MGGGVELQIDVVDEAEDPAGELGVQRGRARGDNARAWHRLDDAPEVVRGLRGIAGDAQRRDVVLAVGGLTGDAVR